MLFFNPHMHHVACGAHMRACNALKAASKLGAIAAGIECTNSLTLVVL